MKKTRFFICAHCGNQVQMVHDAGVPLFCCGQKMEELIPNTEEASGEKHIPVVTRGEGVLEVNVGAVDHPMADVHHIGWVYLQTEKVGQRIDLKPGEAPKAIFRLGEDKPLAVYAWCNLHGLWMTELN